MKKKITMEKKRFNKKKNSISFFLKENKIERLKKKKQKYITCIQEED